MTTIQDKIELVQNTFKEAKKKASSTKDLIQLQDWLLNVPNEFISVAYEGASMEIAIKNIKETNSLERWNKFYHDFGLIHSSQIHVGLGWAFSELNVDLTDFDLTIDPISKCRVLDGYGYYEGIFRRRRSIRKQLIPQHLSELDLRAYDQGLGRSLWYISQGEVEKLVKIINLFSDSRGRDLWRGVGIAVAYVGGIEALDLQQLVKGSGQYLPVFKSGVSLLIQSRFKANTIAADTKSICDFLFNKDCSIINDQLIEFELETKSTPELRYFDWVKKIEENLCC